MSKRSRRSRKMTAPKATHLVSAWWPDFFVPYAIVCPSDNTATALITTTLTVLVDRDPALRRKWAHFTPSTVATFALRHGWPDAVRPPMVFGPEPAPTPPQPCTVLIEYGRLAARCGILFADGAVADDPVQLSARALADVDWPSMAQSVADACFLRSRQLAPPEHWHTHPTTLILNGDQSFPLSPPTPISAHRG